MKDRTWLPGAGALVFLLAALAAWQGARQGLLDDPGLGWHLRNIDAMLAQGGWLTEDPFTDRDPPGPWYTNQWLGELPYWAGWRLFGEEGIAAVNAVLIGLIGYLLYRISVEDGAPWPVAVAWAVLGLAGTSVSWAARPNVITVLFVLLTARVLERYHARAWTAARTWWLVPLFAAWANTHGGFIAGLILLALAWLVEVAVTLGSLEPLKRKTAGEGVAHLTRLGLACAAATLLNPYAWRLYPWVFSLLGDAYFMGLNLEWKAVDFRSPGAMRYELLLLSLILLLGVSDRRPSLLELAFVVAWLHLALTGFRYVALWVVIVVPTLSRQSLKIDFVRQWAREKGLNTDPGSLYHTRPDYGHWGWLIAFATMVFALAAMTQGRHVRHNQEMVPTRALDRFVTYAQEWAELNGRRPRLFHAYDWGGYVTWRGWPGLKNHIDDRNEAQGRERTQRYFATIKAEGDWRGELADTDLVCIYPTWPLAAQLRGSAEWVEIKMGEEDFAVTFARKAARLPGPPP